MEPVTHILAGACIARSGFHRRVAYATAAMAIAAEFPDIDTVWGLRGPIKGFAHHRGITHTFLGVPFEAGLLLLAVWAWHRWRGRRRSIELPPVRWGALYALLLLALLSHLLLDYTNNYGLRPFFPFNPHWYAASVVFIFDPLLFVFLIAGLAVPGLLRFVSQEQAGSRQTAGPWFARLALLGVVALWGLRFAEHRVAVELAQNQTLRPAPQASAPDPGADTGPLPAAPSTPLLQPLRVWASPDPISPFRWYTVADFGPAYRLGTADTRNAALAAGETFNKPPPSAQLRAAEDSPLGRVYLDWSAMPWISVDTASTTGSSAPQTVVSLEDLRFRGDSPLLRSGEEPPLTGTVTLDSRNRLVRQTMNGRSEDTSVP